MTLSMPTISRRMPTINITEMSATSGKARITIDKIIARAPKPICAARAHTGAFKSLMTLNMLKIY
jgi:hypothetical protein